MGMHETSDLTVIGKNAQTERVFRCSELLRSELADFIQPKALSAMLDLAAQSAANTPTDEVLREMRACIAGILLNRVGDFMVKMQPAIDGVERVTRAPSPRGRAAA
jgi:hypothetical protein